MLRISTSTRPDNTLLIALEGSLTGPWIDEVRRTVREALQGGRTVTLDLENLWFLDLEAVALLRGFSREQVISVNGSAFVVQQLENEG